MYRTIQEEKGNKRAAENNEEKDEEKRPKQQFDKDYTLEPYEGVSPEYMEMSESLFDSLFSFCSFTSKTVGAQCEQFVVLKAHRIIVFKNLKTEFIKSFLQSYNVLFLKKKKQLTVCLRSNLQ